MAINNLLYMAQKRMFDRAIIETDRFLNISLSAKALYFLLGMEADDEGFVSPNRVIRLYGGEIGDIKNLIDTGLIIPFESGVVVITHWNTNNYLDKNRITPTQYQDEKKTLLTKDRKYWLNIGLTDVQPGEERREENRIEQERIEQYSTDFERWWNLYPLKKNKLSSYKEWCSIDSKLAPKIIDLIDLQVKNNHFRSKGEDFIPYPLKWLQDKRWEDTVIILNVNRPQKVYKIEELTEKEREEQIKKMKEIKKSLFKYE